MVRNVVQAELKTAQEIENALSGYDPDGIAILKNIFQSEIITGVKLACTESFFRDRITFRGEAAGPQRQTYSFSFTLRNPLLVLVEFAVVCAPDNGVQKTALKLTHDKLNKVIVINNVAHAEDEIKEIEQHVKFSKKLFSDLNAFMRRKIEHFQGQKLRISEQEILDVIPCELRQFGEFGYSWMCNRSNNFFPQ